MAIGELEECSSIFIQIRVDGASRKNTSDRSFNPSPNIDPFATNKD